MMSPQDQAFTIGSALLNSKKLTAGINKLEESVNTKTNLLNSNFPGLFTESELLGLNSTNDEKTDGEDI
jgi:hypothetical protein